MQRRLDALWNRGPLGKAVIVLGVLVIACCVIGVLVPRTPRPRQGAAPTGAPAAAGATAAPVPTEAPAPTAGPTNTPVPTDTPEPTATPSPIPATATPVPPVELSGTGATVTDKFTPPGDVNRVFFTHKGQRNFIVHVFDANGGEDSLANEIGNYNGVRYLLGQNAPYYFEVKADGPWTIRVEAISAEPAAAQGLEGHGDYVSGLFVPDATGPVPYNLTHSGERNFIVHIFCAGGQDSVANEIGAFQGSVVVRFSDAPCFWDVQADGDWTIAPK